MPIERERGREIDLYAHMVFRSYAVVSILVTGDQLKRDRERVALIRLTVGIIV